MLHTKHRATMLTLCRHYRSILLICFIVLSTATHAAESSYTTSADSDPIVTSVGGDVTINGKTQRSRLARHYNATTYGFCSPIVSNVTGNVTITCKGVDPKHLELLNQQLAQKQLDYEQKLREAERWRTSYLKTKQVLAELKPIDTGLYQRAQRAFDQGDYDAVHQIADSYFDIKDIEYKAAAKVAYLDGLTYNLQFKYKQAFKQFEKAVGLDRSNIVYYADAGNSAMDVAQYDDAIYFIKKALKITSDVEIKVRLWNNLGIAWTELGNHDKAISYYEKPFTIDLKKYNPKQQDVMFSWNNLGMAWFHKGQYDKSLNYFEKSLAIGLHILGQQHPFVARVWGNIGNVFEIKGQHDKALNYFEKALASNLKNFGVHHPWVAENWNGLGIVLSSIGKNDKAISYYEKAMASNLKTYGAMHPSMAHQWINMGIVFNKIGQYDKAISYYEKALKIELKIFGPQHQKAALVWFNLGSTWSNKEQFDKAVKYLDKALKIFIINLGETHPYTIASKEALKKVRYYKNN